MFKALAFLVLAATGWTALHMDHVHDYFESRARRDAEAERISLLKTRLDRLKRQQRSLASNGLEAERVARTGLGMQLPGEKVIYLKREAEPEPPATTTSQALAAPAPPRKRPRVTGTTTRPAAEPNDQVVGYTLSPEAKRIKAQRAKATATAMRADQEKSGRPVKKPEAVQ